MLSSLVALPVIGSLVLFGLDAKWVKPWALGISLIILALSSAMLVGFDPSVGSLQWSEHLDWIEPLGLTYSLGVDGLSVLLVVLNALLTVIAIYSSSASINRPHLYYCLVLLLCGGVNGAFMAQNLLLFFLFYEVELIPLYLLIAIWGGQRRQYAATKFLLYTALSGILLLIGFLGVVWLSGSSSFDFDPSLTAQLSPTAQVALLIVILLGFGIKVPCVPLHTWLPDAHVEASTPVSVLLAGVLLKLGSYGIIRFGVLLFPDTWPLLAPWVAGVAVVNVLYGAAIAITQTDMKKMVAYSSVAHMGYILLACAAATPLSILGATMQMVSHGLISALLFLLVGIIYAKVGSRDLYAIRGLLNPDRGLPVVGSLMILATMASAGTPGMVGFIAEFIVFRSSWPTFPVATLLAMIGTGLTAVYFVILLNNAFFGRLTPLTERLPQVSWPDRLPSVFLAVIVVLLGLQPHWLLRWSEATTQSLVSAVSEVATLW